MRVLKWYRSTTLAPSKKIWCIKAKYSKYPKMAEIYGIYKRQSVLSSIKKENCPEYDIMGL